MPIREMTADEIRKALRHAAEVAFENRRKDWWAEDVIMAFDAYRAAERCSEFHENAAKSRIHSAHFLLLAAEAHE